MIKAEVNKGTSELAMNGSILELLADTAILLKHISIKISESAEEEGYRVEPDTVIDAIINAMKEVDKEMEIEKAEAEKNQLKKNKIININQLKQIKDNTDTPVDPLDTLMNAIFPKE